MSGSKFCELHLIFEEHYTEMAGAVDVIAERRRILEVAAPGNCMDFSRLSLSVEVEGGGRAWRARVFPAPKVGLDLLINACEKVVKTSRVVLKLAQSTDDESTAALV